MRTICVCVTTTKTKLRTALYMRKHARIFVYIRAVTRLPLLSIIYYYSRIYDK